MSHKKDRHSIISYKLLYTVLTVFVYLIGRSFPLHGVNLSAITEVSIDTQNVMSQVLNGDINRVSIFALGISPIMMSSILIQIAMSFRSTETKSKFSPRKMNYISLTLTTIMAFALAISRAGELPFYESNIPFVSYQLIATLEMVTGTLLIMYMSDRNKKYGIGGQSAIIFVNILDGIIKNIRSYTERNTMILAIAISVLVMIVFLIMENTEKRIPLQRISIHNIYADKNYLAIKLNPIGVMPAMFSTAFFMIPQTIVKGLAILFPHSSGFQWVNDNLVLTKPLGISCFIVVLYILTIGFSFVFVNPAELTKQFLQSGDSIENLHPGDDTKRYLKNCVWNASIFSATVMSIGLGLPMFLQYYGDLNAALVMLPSSIMMLTGVWCNLYQEIRAVHMYDKYQRFI